MTLYGALAGANNSASLRGRKGPDRPYMNQERRQEKIN
nr:MAG TPA_asm: hypothetical protein [Caudoviricetes sp.]